MLNPICNMLSGDALAVRPSVRISSGAERARSVLRIEKMDTFGLTPGVTRSLGQAREREFWELRPTTFARRMDMAEKMLTETGAFFVGKEITYADFQVRS